ncbi:MAG: membrane protein insertion efficiency factor YidD [Gammaproteobacteria bacterium]|nr:membrane protein insertion efficiency factor YidD [Gammaproteobacteria bacterium]
METLKRFPQKILTGLIKSYQFALSPLLGQHCRFFPSCSAYMLEAIQMYGVLKGIRLGIQRLLRCHPFCEGGVDSLPERQKNHD